MEISASHVIEWREQGYTIIEAFLTAAELQDIALELEDYFPSWDEFAAHRLRYKELALHGGSVSFPYIGCHLNILSVHEDLLSFVERALGTREVFLTQSRGLCEIHANGGFRTVASS